ncbi:MAG TPA: DNA translocase FtsK 4TM domain-containing protein [Armatimonadota bacterium]
MAQPRRRPATEPPDHLSRDLVAVALATLGALVLVSLLLSTQAYFSRYVSEALLLAFGWGAYLVAAGLLAGAVYYFLEKDPLGDRRVLAGSFLLFLVIVTLFHLPHLTTPKLLPAAKIFVAPEMIAGGGYLGAALAVTLLRVLGVVGIYVFLGGVVIASLLLITQASVRDVLRRCGEWRASWSENEPRSREVAPEPRRRRAAGKRQPDEGPRVDLSAEAAEPAKPSRRRRPAAGEAIPPPIPDETPESVQLQIDPPISLPPLPRPRPRVISGNYQLPPVEMLKLFDENSDREEMREETQDRIETLEDTLESFGIIAKVTHYERGPVLTRYEVEPERGIRVSKITSLADDLAMSLAAVDVRVEAPIPGKAAIGIEVPNEHRSMVSLRGLLEAPEYASHRREELPLALGRDIAGVPVIADLVAMPHLLIAGATGSGKSVCLHTVILSLVMMHTPEEVRLIMIDPKRVEMAIYDGIPHLISPVVHSVKMAADIMRKAIREMEKRYDRFALKGVVNLNEYNDRARLSQDDELEKFDPLPRVVIVIDELADLMMQAKAEFEYSICRLAQLARATGIHLVVATQRPSVKILTGNIKANMPSRISLAVASIHDSRTILDGLGAERLIGHGDMLYAPLDAPKPRRIQGSFVPREDINKIAEHLREQGEPQFEIVPELEEGEDDFSEEMETSDELYAAAVQYVVMEQMASVSMIQRRFKVGYARAGRLIDDMEQRGVIGPHEGSKPRQVLVGPGRAEAALGGPAPVVDYEDDLEDEEEGVLMATEDEEDDDSA